MTHCVVFCLSTETFDDLVRREFCRPPDQGLLAVAADPRVTEMYVVDPWRSVIAELVRRRRLPRTEVVQVSGRAVRRVRPLRLRRDDPTSISAVGRAYRRLDRRLARLARSSGAASASLVSYHPFVGGHCGPSWAGQRVFVARDDWASAPRKRPYWVAYRDAYRRIAKHCTAVFAVSSELADRIAPGRGEVIPNGVDGELWAAGSARARSDVPEGPYAVYSGSIEVRLDLGLLDRVLEVIPTVVLAGPVMTRELREELLTRSGVVLTGSLSQRELAEVVSHAAVGVIPHRVTPMTEAMSPLKLYEYLAAGLPVVATDLAGVREARHLSSRVWLCSDADDWAGAVRAALAAGQAPLDERAAVLEKVSWKSRLEPLVQAAGPW